MVLINVCGLVVGEILSKGKISGVLLVVVMVLVSGLVCVVGCVMMMVWLVSGLLVFIGSG